MLIEFKKDFFIDVSLDVANFFSFQRFYLETVS